MTGQDTGKKNKSYPERDSPETDLSQSKPYSRNQRQNDHRLQGGMFYKQTI